MLTLLRTSSPLFILAVLPESVRGMLALLGRTHVIMIHFPIALLLMAALGEIWSRIRGRPASWTTATLLAGALGSVFAMSLGWILIWFSGYESSDTLALHQYLGTATAILATTAAALHWKLARIRHNWWTTGLILLTASLVGITGHLGGTLVHGNIFNP